MALRRELRAAVQELSGGICEWASCHQQGEQLAHIEPSGLGGRPSMDRLENVAWLCTYHHDVFDGRRKGAHHELRKYVAMYVHEQRRRIGWTPDDGPGSP